jgi:glycosyltransferase involved in cell wall biosynthesis
MNAFVSICIPAYKRPENIRRLLRSVAQQSFKDVEIIVSDDSPDGSVESVLPEFNELPIRYSRNIPPLGTPANWNHAIAMANGEWIKLMHDDDWFADEKSLQQFVEKTIEGKAFIFSRYKNVFENGQSEQPQFPASWKERIIQNPVTLLANNVIGPPSVTLIHSSVKEQYDKRMKWRVDMDYYMGILEKSKSYSSIDQPLINVGISSTQVTNDCINVPGVELPEGLLLLQKHGVSPLRNILVYDAWWRILRNVHVRKPAMLFEHAPNGPWPQAILNMVRHQSLIPYSLLKLGPVSKPAMAFSYLLNRKYLKD